MLKIICRYTTFITLLVIPGVLLCQDSPTHQGTTLSEENQWIDSVYNQFTLDEKIGQLFMIRAHSNLGEDHIRSVKNQIREYHVGGLCFFQGTAEEQARLTNSYQEISETPLLVAIDAEWGLGMRFKENAISFPRQLMLGAIQDNSLIYEMGLEIGKQLKAIGVHVNFAPVADVNNNPLNPVINDRSFGEDRYNVSAKCYQYMKGMQDVGVIACAKHFPGHGDTDVDSHLDLPVIHHDMARLDSIELYPFRVLIEKGIKSMMVAHLSIPAIDSVMNYPTTLSNKTITGLLRNRLGFDGLIFTDALEMKGVTKHHEPGDVETLAFQAGNDMLVLPEDIAVSFKKIKDGLAGGTIDSIQVEQSVKRILRSKYRVGLNKYQPVKSFDLDSHIRSDKAIALKNRLIENALTLVKNKRQLVPVQKVDDRNFGSLIIGANTIDKFKERIDSYAEIDHFSAGTTIDTQTSTTLLTALEQKDLVFVGMGGMVNKAAQNFGLDPSILQLLKELNGKTEIILVLFGNPYALKYFTDFKHILVAYDDDLITQDLAAQALFGAFGIRGRLPVTASPEFVFNSGYLSNNLKRLGYSIPARVGLNVDTLNKIRDLANELIEKRAAPGCQVLVAKDGKIVFHETYGHHTYQKRRPVRKTDLYDVASITKVAATTLAVMNLYEDQKIDIDHSLGHYMSELEGSNKAPLNISKIMSHHAGLIPWIPFYAETVSTSRHYVRPSPKYYKSKFDGNFSVPVAKDLYLDHAYTYQLWNQIIQSELRPSNRYRYSDLGFYLLSNLISKVTQTELDYYCQRDFYGPLGLKRTCFNPHECNPIERIVPSEEDNYFRRQRIQGYVHDMGSAMLGGVSGHAGLFSNAEELAVIMQMLLNGGTYGGSQFLEESTIEHFTQRVPESSRRAIGFDMKELNSNRKNLTSPEASSSTYGHTGFTGTCVWNDPEHDLVYVFLSNRTFPTMRNNKMNKLEFRERIHTLIYHAIESSE
jgi:beta-glucosidase-like glycosyl hydrolase/CubicO group peptidase (beta-lactamase class C family)